MRRLYLDHAATTPVDPAVTKAMAGYFSSEFGNASSLYHHGQQARLALESARKKAALLVKAAPEEIVFTSGGTESDNMAVFGAAMAARRKGNHIITTKIEHHAILEPCAWLETQGFRVTYIEPDTDGIVSPDKVRQAMTSKTVLVSVMHVNNEIGTIQPVSEIGRICSDAGVAFHTDAVQSYGKIPIDVRKMNIDLLTASSHKIYGPKGVGLLYVRKGLAIEPLLHGGHQERGMRSGTENVSGIVGFGEASGIALREMDSEARRLAGLRDRLIRGVLKIQGSHLNGHPTERLPGNANFRFDGIEGEALILRLDSIGIEASTGSACSSRELKPSHVLTAIGLRPEQAHGSLRITLGRSTTEKDIDFVLARLPRIVSDLRRISPFWKE
jgi:cysteine desulfurase